MCGEGFHETELRKVLAEVAGLVQARGGRRVPLGFLRPVWEGCGWRIPEPFHYGFADEVLKFLFALYVECI